MDLTTEFCFRQRNVETEKSKAGRTKDHKVKVCLYFDYLLSLVFPPADVVVFRDFISDGLSGIVVPLLCN